MESVLTMNAIGAKTADPVVRRQQMPMTFLQSGESAEVLKVRGSEGFRHHLENLGFVPGTSIRVISEQAGNYIVEVKGAQIALDKSSASKVITG